MYLCSYGYTSWLHACFCACLIYSTYSEPLASDIGYFWQITDFHYDANYSVHGDPTKDCHYSPSTVHYNIGEYGEHSCDAPWKLVLSSIAAMKEIHSQPDYILWTGDSVPHVDDSTYNEEKVFNIIGNITDALIDQFPDTQILPSFGNHDPYPYGQMPVDDPYYYSSILNVSHWDKLLPDGATETFLKGGYYSYDVSPMLKIICLNTALYLQSDNITADMDDPSGQFAWLTSQLEASRLAKQKVHITGHVPPGAFEWFPLVMFFHLPHNEKYLDVVGSYNYVVTAHFYGHIHTDTIRVFTYKGVMCPMFISPAVTPWANNILSYLYNNPSARLYSYDRNSLKLLDYQQYYLNLPKANAGSAVWELEYQFTKAYDVDDLTPAQVYKAAQNIVNQPPEKYFDKYIKYNMVSAHENFTCDDICMLSQKCTIFNLQQSELQRCYNPVKLINKDYAASEADETENSSLYIAGVVIGVVVLVVIIIAIIVIFYLKPRQPSPHLKSYKQVLSYGSIA